MFQRSVLYMETYFEPYMYYRSISAHARYGLCSCAVATRAPVGTHASPRTLAQLCLAKSVSHLVLLYADNVPLWLTISKYILRTRMVVCIAFKWYQSCGLILLTRN